MIFDKIDQWFLFSNISNFIVSNFIPYFSYDLDSFVELHDLKLMGLRTFLILYDYILTSYRYYFSSFFGLFESFNFNRNLFFIKIILYNIYEA